MRGSNRYTIQILGFVAFILAFGTLGYSLIEDGWSVGEAFYMTVITITTVGFGEVHELSSDGRIFTIILVFLGFGTAALFATQIARLILESEFAEILTKKKMGRKIMKIKDHYIVCGYGRIGSTICDALEDERLPFVIIEHSDESTALAHGKGYCVLKGDATTDAVLKEAGIHRALGVVAALSPDADNLLISLAARELNPQIFIIARGEEPEVEDRMMRAGADIVVSPMLLGGQQIAQLITRQAGKLPQAAISEPDAGVLGFFSLRTFRHSQEGMITVADAVKESDALLAIAIKRTDGSLMTTPPDDMQISSYDSVIIAVRNRRESEKAVARGTDNKKILFVDDHKALTLLFARKIRSGGHQVITAASGDEAISMAQEHEPDLIVLDVMMPGKSGYDVCRSLKELPKFKNVPIILFSGKETEEFLTKGKESGADACIRKTQNASELITKIEELLANA